MNLDKLKKYYKYNDKLSLVKLDKNLNIVTIHDNGSTHTTRTFELNYKNSLIVTIDNGNILNFGQFNYTHYDMFNLSRFIIDLLFSKNKIKIQLALNLIE